MSTQITQKKIDCENVEQINDGQVYCWFRQDWIGVERCIKAIENGTCNAEHRKRAPMDL